MFPGRLTEGPEFLELVIVVRVYAGEFCTSNSMIEWLTCNEFVGGLIPS